MANKHSVKDDGDSRKYYAAIPNIVLRIGLNPYELALYVYLKTVTGEDGVCWKSTATIAKDLSVGSGTISRTKILLSQPREALGGKPLIAISTEMQNGGHPNHAITITDIWPENMAELARVRMGKATRSTQEQRVPQAAAAPSSGETTRSTDDYKEEPIKKNQEEKKELSAHVRLMDFLSSKIGPIPNGAKEGKAIKWLLSNGYDPVQCEACYEALASEDWRTSSVTWTTVMSNIGAWLGRANGNGHRQRETASQRNVRNIKESLEYAERLSQQSCQDDPEVAARLLASGS